jgi:hypothetical protein
MACSSTETSPEEFSSETADGAPEFPTEQVSEDTLEKESNPAAEKLEALLKQRGWQAVGLELETADTVEKLRQVFKNPATRKLRVRAFYTGAEHRYDAKEQTLTLCAQKSVANMLSFIKKKVPAKAAAGRAGK